MDAAAALLNPAVLFFVLGALVAFARSDLAIPDAVTKALSLYLMMAIGLKGGVAISETGFTGIMLATGGVGILLSFLLPLPAFAMLRQAGLGRVDAGAIAAHYGSVSVVTFVTASDVLAAQGMPPAGFMVAVLALMETPAIVSGLLLARRGTATVVQGGDDGGGIWREVLLNASVVLLIGSLGIGLMIGKPGFSGIAPVFDAGFKGLLCLFLLDMGLIAARRLQAARLLNARLVALAIGLPLVNGLAGTVIGTAIGLDTGSAAALGVLAGSASYIAVPAAMRIALPEADAGRYLVMSLGISFPFNIVVGIALWAAVARWLV